MDRSREDNFRERDKNSSNFEEHDHSATEGMRTETDKEVGNEHKGPDQTPATSQPRLAVPDQKDDLYDLKSGKTSTERHVDRKGDIAGGMYGESFAQDPSVSRCQEMILSSSWHGEGIQPPAVTARDVNGRPMAAKALLSPNEPISDAMLKSPIDSENEKDGDNDDDQRIRRSSQIQKVRAVGEQKGGGEEDGDGRPRLVKRLMVTVFTACLLVCTAYLSAVPVLSQYLLRRIVMDHFNLTNITLKKTPCANGENTSMQRTIDWLQGQTSQQLFYFTVVQSVPNVIVALFVGSYADYFGRKFLVLGPMIGGFFKSLIVLLVIYLQLDIQFLYLAYALDGMMGSVHVLTMGLFAAIADVTISSRQRVMLFAMLEIALALAGGTSQIGTGFLIDALGFVVPSFIIACLFFLACLCVLFFMPETLRTRPERLVLNPLVHLRKVFGFYIWDGTLPKRFLFILGQIIMFLVMAINYGRMPVETLFEMNSPLCWGPIEIGIFTGARLLLQNLAGVAVLKVLSKCVRIELICILGLLSGIAGFTVQSLADIDLMMYISGVSGALLSVVAPVARTLMSRMVSADSQGALFASLSAVETLCILVASVIFNNVYTATLSVFRGAVFLVMAAMLTVDLVLVIVFILVSRKFPHFQKIQIEVDKPDADASPPTTPTCRRPSDETTPLLIESNGIDGHLGASLQQQEYKIRAPTRRTRSFVY